MTRPQERAQPSALPQPARTSLVVTTTAMALAVQSLTSMAMLVPTVLAPVAAPELGVQATLIGLLVAFNYFVAVVSGLVCDALIARYGPVRVFQFAIGLVVVGLTSGFVGTLPMAFVLGALVGTATGFVNPASSTILHQVSPPQYRSLIFSIKQTGVPLGSGIASLIIPALLLHMQWRYAVLALGVASAFLLIVVAPFRSIYDRDRNPRQPIRLTTIGAPVALVWSRPELLTLALASAVYSAVQMSLFTYLMLYLIVDLGHTLVLAGMVFSVAQAMGIVSRPAWGVVADRLQAPRQLLGGLGIVMGLCGVAASLLTPGTPFALIVVLCAVYGASAVGWNGVYLAEVARIAPPGKVGVVTGGVMLFTFSGALMGPPIFSTILGLTGSYGLGFLFFALLPIAMGLKLAFSIRSRASSSVG